MALVEHTHSIHYCQSTLTHSHPHPLTPLTHSHTHTLTISVLVWLEKDQMLEMWPSPAHLGKSDTGSDTGSGPSIQDIQVTFIHS